MKVLFHSELLCILFGTAHHWRL